MLYGENKTRSMARSILPSTARKKYRVKLASIKRRHRRSVRRAVTEELAYTESSDVQFDTPGYPDARIRYAVRRRRDYDKVAPFMRWAAESTKGLDDPEKRRAAVKKVLSDDLPGRHALTHIDRMEEFRVPTVQDEAYRRSFSRTIPWKGYTDPFHRSGAELEAVVADSLRLAVEDGRHARINRDARRHHSEYHYVAAFRSRPAYTRVCDGCTFRPFLGLHDIDAWAAFAVKNRYEHPEYARAVLGYGTRPLSEIPWGERGKALKAAPVNEEVAKTIALP